MVVFWKLLKQDVEEKWRPFKKYKFDLQEEVKKEFCDGAHPF